MCPYSTFDDGLCVDGGRVLEDGLEGLLLQGIDQRYLGDGPGRQVLTQLKHNARIIELEFLPVFILLHSLRIIYIWHLNEVGIYKAYYFFFYKFPPL